MLSYFTCFLLQNLAAGSAENIFSLALDGFALKCLQWLRIFRDTALRPRNGGRTGRSSKATLIRGLISGRILTLPPGLESKTDCQHCEGPKSALLVLPRS
jgi:hypothetical protein